MFGEGNEADEPVTGGEGGEADTGAAATGAKDDHVTLADDDSEIAVGDDEDEVEGDEDAEGGDKPRKRSRSARYKERIARLERELEDSRRPARRPAPRAAGDELVAPKEADFPNDYLAYDRALRAFETKKAIREEAQRGDEAAQADEREREHRQRTTSYNRKLDEVRDRIPDFDTVMADARSVEVRDDVRDLILESPKGPLIAYYLAKTPDKIDELNRMNATQAARFIGSLEARIRGPKPKAATNAKPSPKPPKGGADARGVTSPDKMTNEQYREWRKTQK